MDAPFKASVYDTRILLSKGSEAPNHSPIVCFSEALDGETLLEKNQITSDP